MTDWETAFSTPWFSVEWQYVRDQVGRIGTEPFYRFQLPDGAVILPITPEGRIVLIRQFRQALNRTTIEFPSGAIDPGETPEGAMTRELYEETGYRCATMDLVLTGELRIDRENAVNYFFVGQGAVRDPDYRSDEPIETLLVTPAEFKALVLDGRFDQIATLPTVLLAIWRLGLNFDVLWSGKPT